MSLLALALALTAVPAGAQVDVGTGLGPDAMLYSERSRPQAQPVLPVPLAASLAFDATTWATVQASSVPARDLTALFRRGYYKLELIQVVLIARQAGLKIEQISSEHDKGKSLREIAASRSIDFDALYEEAMRIDRQVVDRLLPSVMTVSSEAGAGAPHARRPKRALR